MMRMVFIRHWQSVLDKMKWIQEVHKKMKEILGLFVKNKCKRLKRLCLFLLFFELTL